MRLSLSLLGVFQATLDGRPITDFYSRKVRALLAYLAVEAGQRHTRAVLAALLWPDWTDRAALGNLRFSLSKLRQAIGDQYSDLPLLLINRDTVQFNAAADSQVDVDCFEQELVASRWEAAAADGQPEFAVRSAIGHLETAASLYRGGFLEGFSVGDSAAFEEWALFERQRLEQKMRSALQGLAALHHSLGDYAAVERYARRLLAIDPWDEPANGELMSALAKSGRRNAALRHYAAFREELAKELGAEPSAEITTLYGQIKRGCGGRPEQESPPAPAPPPSPGPRSGASRASLRDQSSHPARAGSSAARISPPSRRLVAREPQLAQLHACLEQALAGQGCVAFVSGEAGSGKTALMSGFAHRALTQHSGLLVAGGRCNVYTGIGDPYLPFREIAYALAGDVESRGAAGEVSSEGARRLRAARPAVSTALVEAAPDLIDRFVPASRLTLSAPQPNPTPEALRLDDAARRRTRETTGMGPEDIFSQYTGFLLALARKQPLLLILDDLQWADRGSLSLLFHIGRRLAGARILILGAYRPEELALCPDGSRHPLLALLNEMRRVHGAAELDLSQADGRGFVAGFIDTEPNHLDVAFRDTLAHHTGGHPLFTIELLRGMQERGELGRDARGAWVVTGELDWTMLPPRAEAVIAERVDRLPLALQKLLTAASVEGEVFTAEVVGRVLGLDEAEVRLGLEALNVQHRMVRSRGMEWVQAGKQRLSHYSFQHFLFHKYLYERLDHVERSRLHALAGEALERLYGAESAAIAVELAWHFERAGLTARAADHLLKAGNQAMRLAGYREAVAYFSRGLGLIMTLPDSPERKERELELRLALAGPLAGLHRMTDAIRVQEMTPIVPLGRGAGGRHAIYALAVEATTYRDRGDFNRVLALGEQMLAAATASEDRQAIMLAHFIVGSTEAFGGGGYVRARTELEAVLGLYSDAEDRGLVALFGVDTRTLTIGLLALMLWGLGYADQAASRMHEGLALAQSLAHAPSLAAELTLAIWLDLLTGADPDPQPHIETLCQLVNHNGLRVMGRHAQVYSGWLLTRQGRIAEGIKMMREAMMTDDWAPGDGGLLSIVAETCLDAGLYDEGLAAIDGSRSMRKTGIGRLSEAELHRLRGALLFERAAACGDDAALAVAGQEAESCYSRAIEVARQQQARGWELRAATEMARLWQLQGRRGDALGLLTETYGSFTEGFDTRDLQEARALIAALE